MSNVSMPMSGLGFEPKLYRSYRVRASDYREPWFVDRAKDLCEPIDYNHLHRKLWEFAVIAQVCKQSLDTSTEHKYALGFGVGKDPIACYLASLGVRVLATDFPDDNPAWSQSGQWAETSSDLFKPGVCTPEEFTSLVEFMPVDMNHIPVHLTVGAYDLTWSCGSFEHIGGIEASIQFFVNQMKCLRPGGIAVHTTEFNYGSNDDTIDEKNLCLLRECDLKEIEYRIASNGDKLFPLDLEPGHEPADQYVDSEPFYQGDFHHLNIRVGNHVTTSIALIAQKG